MICYNQEPKQQIEVEGKTIHVFTIEQENIDAKTVDSFGEEWKKFNSFTDDDINVAGNQYFDIVPDEYVSGKMLLDLGCGTGRWAKYLSARAGFIECVDPSNAVYSAARLLTGCANIRIAKAAVNNIPFPDNSFDFVFSLGVLHHIPDTFNAMQSCVKKVKPGGYFLVYLYYNLDNRGVAFGALFFISNLLRKSVSLMPSGLKGIICDMLAAAIYMPLVLLSRALIGLGMERAARHIPLSYYADKSFRMIRNDALDRFGTPLEQRFSKKEIAKMMKDCGLADIVFSEKEPYWHAVGKKK